MIQLGSTFRPRGDNTHVHVVISSPQENDGQVLVVRLTTFRPEQIEDTSCILNEEDHLFIRRPTVVNYGELGDPNLWSVEAIEKAVQDNLLVLWDTFSQEVMDRILAGAKKSPFLKKNLKKFLS